MLVIHEDDTRVIEPTPHGAIGMSTAYRISDAAPQPRAMEFRKRVLQSGAAIGLHGLSHDDGRSVLSRRPVARLPGDFMGRREMAGLRRWRRRVGF